MCASLSSRQGQGILSHCFTTNENDQPFCRRNNIFTACTKEFTRHNVAKIKARNSLFVRFHIHIVLGCLAILFCLFFRSRMHER